MLKCSICEKNLPEQEALVRTESDGTKKIICPACFKQSAGIDYQTFAFRKRSAKLTAAAVLICLMATVYAFYDKGAIYGAAGLILTLLVWLFAGKAKQ